MLVLKLTFVMKIKYVVQMRCLIKFMLLAVLFQKLLGHSGTRYRLLYQT